MSRLADARAVLHAALAPVLPGRVDPYPPPVGRVAAPKVWVGAHRGIPATIGQQTAVTVTRFDVVIVYDGANHAQLAGLDDLIAAVADAISAAPGFGCDGWDNGPPVGLNLDQSISATVVYATTTITARTLCTPTATPVTVPPTPVGVTHV